MPTPFSGMDPYLERRGLWEAIHTRLLVAIADALGPALRPRYRVDVERRTYMAIFPADVLVGKPDVLVIAPPGMARAGIATAVPLAAAPHIVELPMPEEVVERYLEVRDVVTGDAITVIELLSHSNKMTRDGRKQYERKRLQILGSLTNLVEIDLLRAGKPFPMQPLDTDALADYNIVVSPAWLRPRANAYSFGVRDAIPDIPIPLRRGESQPVLGLNRILHDLYDRGSYDMAVDYRQPPQPPLSAEDAHWAQQLLEQNGVYADHGAGNP